LSPAELIETHSADVLRYWAANSRLGTDTYFSADELGIARRFITKLWNASKFAASHLQDFDSAARVYMLPVDRWIIERCNQTISEADRYLNKYEIGLARHELDDFFWKDLCDYYLEIVKERLYQPEKHGYRQRRSAQQALYYCLLNILKLYSIYVPHITEYLYQEYFRREEGCISIHKLCWERIDRLDNSILNFGDKLKEIISETRKYRSENSLSMKTEIDKVFINTEQEFALNFKESVGDIRACCCSKEVIISIKG
jgi:valyl-tRNA synthetase